MDNKRKTSSIKFVGLHAHSVAGSPFDGMGYPQEHMEFAYENGSDALALTDHGNMNGLAYQVLHGKKMSQDGKDFKPIYGVEAYFIPSIEEWREHKAEYDKEKKISVVTEELCKGCGTCVAGCPSGAAHQKNFEDKQILSEIEGILA